MNPGELHLAIPGLDLVLKHELARKETKVLRQIIKGDFTLQEMAVSLETTKHNLQPAIKSLRLKKLVFAKNKKGPGVQLIYSLTPSE